jgi:hypothetical protein
LCDTEPPPTGECRLALSEVEVPGSAEVVMRGTTSTSAMDYDEG